MESKVRLYESPIGDAYQSLKIEGPFVRVTTSQECHVEDGLRFWWQATPKDEINKRLEETANKGTILHGYIAETLKGNVVDVQEEWAKKPVDNFINFLGKSGYQARYVEKLMVSRLLGLGGTMDCLAVVNEEVHLLDFKSGHLSKEHWCQVAIYAFMVWENFGYAPHKCKIIGVHRDGGDVEVQSIEDVTAALRVGLCTYERWKWDNRERLLWACCPIEIWNERKKTRGKNRKEFDDENYNQEYEWPWLADDSLRHVATFERQIERVKNEYVG